MQNLSGVVPPRLRWQDEGREDREWRREESGVREWRKEGDRWSTNELLALRGWEGRVEVTSMGRGNEVDGRKKR